MSYENAPATLMLATHCAACGRPLVDADSVETGMGPDCREKYGYDIAAPAEVKADVNARVYAIATGKLSGAEVIGHLLMIRAHGFTVLADKLEDRLVTIEVLILDSATLSVVTPFAPAFTEELKAITPWRRWDAAEKRWLVPASKPVRNAIWAAMRRHFRGEIGRGGEAGFFAV